MPEVYVYLEKATAGAPRKKLKIDRRRNIGHGIFVEYDERGYAVGVEILNAIRVEVDAQNKPPVDKKS